MYGFSDDYRGNSLNEPKWIQMSSNEPKWAQTSLNESK